MKIALLPPTPALWPSGDAERCLETYSRDDVVRYYCGYRELQKPEQTVLQLLLPRLATMRMLEIGIGGGRLTEFFAGRVACYTGIDLCPRMVESCRERFAATVPAGQFAVGDMRRLGHYPAGAFDFVLIGYNTIDHLDHDERRAFLGEMRRVLSPGGLFCFSTHNIVSLGTWIEVRGWLRQTSWRRPLEALRDLRRCVKLVRLNRRELAVHDVADHVIVHNGTHGDYGFHIYYVRPSAQLEALRRAGFESNRVFSLETGAELDDPNRRVEDRWLYYLSA